MLRLYRTGGERTVNTEQLEQEQEERESGKKVPAAVREPEELQCGTSCRVQRADHPGSRQGHHGLDQTLAEERLRETGAGQRPVDQRITQSPVGCFIFYEIFRNFRIYLSIYLLGGSDFCVAITSLL